ncbi:MAG: 16S rRNA (cytidine(1402)-2'-O)-methyltransferase [Bacteroidota bacterium]
MSTSATQGIGERRVSRPKDEAIPDFRTVQQGTLYLVSTPIGNLEDISFRAVKVLSHVDLIAAEDTRTTRILLERYKIRTHMISYFSRNEVKRVPYLIDRLEHGDSVAVVTEAGTPGILDPAFRIVRAAINRGIPLVAVPGPTAFLSAFVVSGFGNDAFAFEGFLPHKKGRVKSLERLKNENKPIILYESPHRVLRTLRDLHHHLGDRRIVIAREITKKFEELLRGRISEVHSILSARSIRGEFVLVVEGKPTPAGRGR